MFITLGDRDDELESYESDDVVNFATLTTFSIQNLSIIASERFSGFTISVLKQMLPVIFSKSQIQPPKFTKINKPLPSNKIYHKLIS